MIAQRNVPVEFDNGPVVQEPCTSTADPGLSACGWNPALNWQSFSEVVFLAFYAQADLSVEYIASSFLPLLIAIGSAVTFDGMTRLEGITNLPRSFQHTTIVPRL